MDNEITIKLSKTQFDLLNNKIKTTQANLGYFPRKILRAAASTNLVITVDQFSGFKQALASLKTGEAETLLDLFFDQGEETAQAIVNSQREAQMLAQATAQAGIGKLKEVTVKDIKKAAKAAAKPKVKVKAGSRKVG